MTCSLWHVPVWFPFMGLCVKYFIHFQWISSITYKGKLIISLPSDLLEFEREVLNCIDSQKGKIYCHRSSKCKSNVRKDHDLFPWHCKDWCLIGERLMPIWNRWHERDTNAWSWSNKRGNTLIIKGFLFLFFYCSLLWFPWWLAQCDHDNHPWWTETFDTWTS